MIWNVRGLGGSKTQQQVWYLRNLLKMNVFALLEPMVELDEFKYCTKFNMEKVVANCNNKIWIFSDASSDVEILENKEQYLHCKISSSQLPASILFNVVYA